MRPRVALEIKVRNNNGGTKEENERNYNYCKYTKERVVKNKHRLKDVGDYVLASTKTLTASHREEKIQPFTFNITSFL